MKLNSFEALNAFAKQLERNIGGPDFHTKVVVTPSSIKEKGVVIKVSPLKTYIEKRPPAALNERHLRVRVSVAGTVESVTGLRQALGAIEAVDRYLSARGLRLEVENETPLTEKKYHKPVPNSRIIQDVSAEDSFMDNPDSTLVHDVQDDRIVTITIPQGG